MKSRNSYTTKGQSIAINISSLIIITHGVKKLFIFFIFFGIEHIVAMGRASESSRGQGQTLLLLTTPDKTGCLQIQGQNLAVQELAYPF